ncbi:hypothetical protein CIPAW_11G153100 [Carya illinoinensis]|uniref:Uncharacterized protein n=1 Tax=Carya illinoinensis TaxID=32201 RepID=A0A8T1P6M7_CARIL|nr:hypothetical protein CIPAW_11G153100 [Carya illinoinensis]KAG6637042.1 hypothetical protein CIPAW_11G153100 [Carya illinoinensis]KAG6637043.1 hypothetical protein CIPAW_11G153100 [Carya illinoinensis]KAG6637044.1 hypothetical protein CIPAW_11G153100 [Carya illinoinensis]
MHSNVVTLPKASIWQEAARIVGEEGFRVFWKGNLITIAHLLPYSSINFYAFDHYKKMISELESRRENMGVDICVHFVAGGLAGITAASVPLVYSRISCGVRGRDARGLKWSEFVSYELVCTGLILKCERIAS